MYVGLQLIWVPDIVSDVSITEMTGQGTSHVRSGGEMVVRNANHWLSRLLVIFIAVSPIPFGSNRPVFWALSATVLAIAALYYAISIARSGGRFRYPVRRLGVSGALFAILCGYLIVQSVPIGFWFGPVMIAVPGGLTLPSMSLSLTPGDTVLMLTRFVSYGLFLFLMLQVSVNRERARAMLRMVAIIIAAHAIYAMLALTQFGDTILFIEKWTYLGSATGTFINRNSLATFIAMGATVCLALLFRELDFTSKREMRGIGNLFSAERFGVVAYAVLLVLMLITLVSTQSRMGLFAGFVGLLTISLLAMGKLKHVSGRTIMFGILASVVVAGALLFAFGGGVLERVGTLERSTNVRAALYEQVWQMVMTRPWLGFGGGSFEAAFPLFHQLPVNPDLVWDKAHSTYLGLWSELGLVFGSIPLVIVVLLAFNSLRKAMSRTRDWVAPAAAFAVIVVSGVHSLVDFSLEIQANSYILLAIIALGIASGDQKTDADH